MTPIREKITIEIDSALLDEVRALAKAERRSMRSLFEEAVSELLNSRRGELPRATVQALHEESIARYGPLYRKLSD